MRRLATMPELWIDAASLLLRLIVAVVFIFYGAQKLFGAFDGPGLSAWVGIIEDFDLPGPAAAMAWIVALAQFFGGICLGIGFLTRLVAIPLVIELIFGIALVHHEGFAASYPLTYIVILGVLILIGPGRWSVDAWLVSRTARLWTRWS